MSASDPAHPGGADARRGPFPQIARPRDAIPLPLLIVAVAIMGLALFLQLEGRRHAAERARTGAQSSLTRLPPAPPPLVIPAPLQPPPPPPPPEEAVGPEASPPAPVARAPAFTPTPAYRPPPPDLGLYVPAPRNRPSAPDAFGAGGSKNPPLVYDQTAGAGAPVNGAAGEARASGEDTARATLIRNRASVIPQGAMIAAVLETPLNSDRPGLARAVVSQDARGFDGSRVLIPKGSRLVGEFKADNSPGLRRVLITWSRLIRPDGVAIRIDSPVSDPLGQAGVGGHVDTHFLQRFSGAVLQSALTIGVNVASTRSTSANNPIYIGVPGQVAQLGQQLTPDNNHPPTVTVGEGAEIAVLVARDLDFSGTPPVR